MVDKDVAGAVVLQVGDLQAVGVAHLGWLEGRIQVLNLHDGLRLLGLWRKASGDPRQCWGLNTCCVCCAALGKSYHLSGLLWEMIVTATYLSGYSRVPKLT